MKKCLFCQFCVAKSKFCADYRQFSADMYWCNLLFLQPRSTIKINMVFLFLVLSILIKKLDIALNWQIKFSVFPFPKQNRITPWFSNVKILYLWQQQPGYPFYFADIFFCLDFIFPSPTTHPPTTMGHIIGLPYLKNKIGLITGKLILNEFWLMDLDEKL